jgi:hypothetical protein
MAEGQRGWGVPDESLNIFEKLKKEGTGRIQNVKLNICSKVTPAVPLKSCKRKP